MTPFNNCGKPFSRILQIIQIQWLHSTSVAIPYIKKYKSYNINDLIQPLQKTFLQKIFNHTKSMTQFHHCGIH